MLKNEHFLEKIGVDTAENGRWQAFYSKIAKKSGNFLKILQKSDKIRKILKIQLDICVDLEKCWKMSLLSLS